jgi:hypothetical protein
MQEKHLFEYAVIRIMPRVEREEFLNTGVVLYCAKQKFLKAIVVLDHQRITTFCPTCDIAELEAHLKAFERISTGGRQTGPIGMLPPAERFRWLTAIRSTVVQTSRVHPGFCTDANEMLEKLVEDLVAVCK